MNVGNKMTRLTKIARDLNIGITTIVEFLNEQGIKMFPDPNAKIDQETLELLEKQFKHNRYAREELNQYYPQHIQRLKRSLIDNNINTSNPVMENDKNGPPRILP